MSRKHKKNERKEVAQSLVELALSMTFLIFLMAGTVDLSRAFFTYIALQDAAQEGAAYGAIDPTNVTEIEARVRQSSSNPIDLSDTTLTGVNVDCTGVDCTANPSSACANSTNFVRVEVTYQFRIIMPLLNGIFPSSTISIGASSTNTILTPGC